MSQLKEIIFDGNIVGQWATKDVLINGRLLDPAESQQYINHSPDGHNWSYAGSGPAQLALSVLLAFLPQAEAMSLYQAFKHEVIALLPAEDFILSMQSVTDWITKKKGGQNAKIQK